MRDTLFGDVPLDQWPPPGGQEESPWNLFAEARAKLSGGHRDEAVELWRTVLSLRDLESRHYLQAWHFLRQHGQQPAPDVAKEVLGAIVEVGLPAGTDVVAAYPDHHARYLNQAGGGVVWEHPDDSLDELIDRLLALAKIVVVRIGPWQGERPPAPREDRVRVSFLTPSGLHFGEGPMAALGSDPMAGAVLATAFQLMQALIAKTTHVAKPG